MSFVLRTRWAAALLALGCGPVSASDVLTQSEPVDPATGGTGAGASISASSGWPSGAGGTGGAPSPGKPDLDPDDAGSAGAGGGSAGAAPDWDPPPPPPDPEFSSDAESFCKKFDKVCGFTSKTYQDAFACKALYDSYPKKKQKCVEGALSDAKSDPSNKHCRAAGGAAYCA